jgi:hypothetical protein
MVFIAEISTQFLGGPRCVSHCSLAGLLFPSGQFSGSLVPREPPLGRKLISIGSLFQLQYTVTCKPTGGPQRNEEMFCAFFRPLELLIFFQNIGIPSHDQVPLNNSERICWARQGLPFCPLVT